MTAGAALLASTALQMDFMPSFVFAFFFLVVIIIIIAAVVRGLSGRGTVQRPLSETTAFPPPPPPDTIMVKCGYCGTEQTWREACEKCGAPLPKPQVP